MNKLYLFNLMIEELRVMEKREGPKNTIEQCIDAIAVIHAYVDSVNKQHRLAVALDALERAL